MGMRDPLHDRASWIPRIDEVATAAYGLFINDVRNKCCQSFDERYSFHDGTKRKLLASFGDFGLFIQDIFQKHVPLFVEIESLGESLVESSTAYDHTPVTEASFIALREELSSQFCTGSTSLLKEHITLFSSLISAGSDKILSIIQQHSVLHKDRNSVILFLYSLHHIFVHFLASFIDTPVIMQARAAKFGSSHVMCTSHALLAMRHLLSSMVEDALYQLSLNDAEYFHLWSEINRKGVPQCGDDYRVRGYKESDPHCPYRLLVSLQNSGRFHEINLRVRLLCSSLLSLSGSAESQSFPVNTERLPCTVAEFVSKDACLFLNNDTSGLGFRFLKIPYDDFRMTNVVHNPYVDGEYSIASTQHSLLRFSDRSSSDITHMIGNRRCRLHQLFQSFSREFPIFSQQALNGHCSIESITFPPMNDSLSPTIIRVGEVEHRPSTVTLLQSDACDPSRIQLHSTHTILVHPISAVHHVPESINASPVEIKTEIPVSYSQLTSAELLALLRSMGITISNGNGSHRRLDNPHSSDGSNGHSTTMSKKYGGGRKTATVPVQIVKATLLDLHLNPEQQEIMRSFFENHS